MANTKRTRTNQSVDGTLAVAGAATLTGGVVGGLAVTGDVTMSSDLDVAGDLTADTLLVGGSPVQPAEVAIFNDTKTSGTNGGDFTSGSWQTRDLNTTQTAQSWAVLASDQVTLSPGTYLIRAEAPAYAVDTHQIRWHNVTDNTTAIIGTPMFETASGAGVSLACVAGVIVVASNKTFEVQHQAQTTRAADGFGIAAGFTSEVYTVLQIQKLA